MVTLEGLSPPCPSSRAACYKRREAESNCISEQPVKGALGVLGQGGGLRFTALLGKLTKAAWAHQLVCRVAPVGIAVIMGCLLASPSYYCLPSMEMRVQSLGTSSEVMLTASSRCRV